MVDSKPRRSASVYWSDDFFNIETNSGYGGMFIADQKRFLRLLPAKSGDEEVAAVLLDALSFSRSVLPAPSEDVKLSSNVIFDMDLYDYKKIAERYQEWVTRLMDDYGYKTRRGLFKNMLFCSVEQVGEVIILTPMRHVRLEGWEGIGKDIKVEISADRAVKEIGAALRKAMNMSC